jgi:integration host factor subunit beta
VAFMGDDTVPRPTGIRPRMTKSELIELIARKQPQLGYKDIELVVKTLLEHMVSALSTGERIEIRGFGSFSLHYRPSRIGRNPKSGEPVSLSAKYVPHFKPGKDLRERVNEGQHSQGKELLGLERRGLL